jgi:hypothetical protein
MAGQPAGQAGLICGAVAAAVAVYISHLRESTGAKLLKPRNRGVWTLFGWSRMIPKEAGIWFSAMDRRYLGADNPDRDATAQPGSTWTARRALSTVSTEAASSPEQPVQPEPVDRADRPGGRVSDHTKTPAEPFNLPGKGESGPRCGDWKPVGVCESCGHLDLAAHKCGRRSCPDCWHRWAREASVRAATRVQAFRHTQAGWRQQVAHAVVSPPESEIQTTEAFWSGKKRAAEIAEGKGWRGFAVIGHPWRATEEAKEEYREEDRDVGLWVWLRRSKDDIITQWTRWSPHYHIIGATGADMEPAKDSDSWNYVFIRSAEEYEGIAGDDSHEDVYGLFRYLVSHTGWPEGSNRQAVTWYGTLANNVFVEDAAEDWQHEKPSEGVVSALRRHIEELAGVEEAGETDDGGGGGGDEMDDCPAEDCDGLIIGVWDIRAYLRQQEPPPEIRKRMKTAWKWRIGEVLPPPGLRHPQTEEQAREAFGVLTDG